MTFESLASRFSKRYILVRYLIRTSNYLERISLFELPHMMNIDDPQAIGVETLNIDN